MPTAEARRQNLRNADTFRFSHLLYLDDLHRDYGVVHLNSEARKAFSDTITVSERAALTAEHQAISKWYAEGGQSAGSALPWPDVMHAQADSINYENLKIASGFELHLKARLLSRDFVLHELDKKRPSYRSLAAAQRQRPITKAEVLAISPYMFDGTQNYLPGLSESSVKFSTIVTVSAYQVAVVLPSSTLDIINDYRVLRNQIHLPGDLVRARHIDRLGEGLGDFLAEFINREIVAPTNDLISRHNSFNRRPLQNV